MDKNKTNVCLQDSTYVNGSTDKEAIISNRRLQLEDPRPPSPIKPEVTTVSLLFLYPVCRDLGLDSTSTNVHVVVLMRRQAGAVHGLAPVSLEASGLVEYVQASELPKAHCHMSGPVSQLSPFRVLSSGTPQSYIMV